MSTLPEPSRPERDRHRPVEEVAVVADDQHRAVIIGDHFLQQVERLQVEIVGRLVEHQQVRAAGELARQQQPRALAAREAADLARRPGRARTGSPSDSPGRASCGPRTSIQSPPSARMSRTLLSGSSRLRCWSIITPLSVFARVTLPSSGSISPVSSLQQSGLAGAVGADHADPVAALDAQREVADDRPLADSAW